MTRAWRLLRGLRLRVTWIAVGWAGAFGMAMFGSKLHGLGEVFVGRVRAWFRARVTWQGASLDQRARMVEDDHYDWVDTDMGGRVMGGSEIGEIKAESTGGGS